MDKGLDMGNKIEKVILDYFKFINTLPYKELKLKFYSENNQFVLTVYCHSLKDTNEYYYSNQKGTVTSIYIKEMEVMFPYSFHVCAHYNRVYD
jgi:hypothetical protein